MPSVTELGPAASTIQSVTIYASKKAEVVRKYELSLSEGDNEIQIAGLSSYIDPQSVRVSGLNASARVVDIAMSTSPTSVFPKPNRALQTKKTSLEAQRLIRQQESAAYLSYMNHMTKHDNVPADQLVHSMQTVVQQRQALLPSIAALDQEIQEIDDAIALEAAREKETTAAGHITIHILVDPSLYGSASSTTQTSSSEEPDENWKSGIRNEIDAEFAPDIALLMEDKAKQSLSLGPIELEQIEREYEGHLQRYVSLANQRYEEKLASERQRRKALAPQQPDENTFLLMYAVSHASWKPLYDVHVANSQNDATSLVTLQYRASITQTTGEDWSNIPLMLSAASDSTQSVDLPRLPTYRIRPRTRFLSFPNNSTSVFGPQQAQQAEQAQKQVVFTKGLFGSAPQANSALFAHAQPAQTTFFGSAKEVGNEPDTSDPAKQFGHNAEFDHAQQERRHGGDGIPLFNESGAVSSILRTTSASVSYSVSHPVKIPSDGATHAVSVATILLSADISRICVPRVKAATYISCTIVNKSEYHLLPGPLNVFLDDKFVARTSINDIMPNESFVCALGVDSSLRVTYERLPGKEQAQFGNSNNDMFGERKRITTHVVRTHITNKHPFKISNLVVRDALPLASTDSVKVTLKKPEELVDSSKAAQVEDNIKVKWTEKTEDSHDAPTGKYEWIVDLEGGKGCSLEAEWEVRTPLHSEWEEAKSDGEYDWM
ncbi:hypothetical protein BDW22DRAFT_1357161 [Trametopsis cervina]|nr:hypothetical protein BDW22DRAFT_1357161 [Trametopsis cervina]